MFKVPEVNRRFTLKTRPEVLPSDENFNIEKCAIPPTPPGKLLIKTLMVALSPWQNQRMKDFKNYTEPFKIGELIDCDVLGQVVDGDVDGYLPGQLVTGRLGWQEYAIASPEQLIAISAEFAETLWLTALSSPGLTAYCCLLYTSPSPRDS